MYILMRGKVTIYILYAKKDEDGDKETSPQLVEKPGKDFNIRQQLGTFVTSLGTLYVFIVRTCSSPWIMEVSKTTQTFCQVN